MSRPACQSCKRPPVEDGLCAYHLVKRDYGPAWAAAAHPNHPEVNGARKIR